MGRFDSMTDWVLIQTNRARQQDLPHCCNMHHAIREICWELRRASPPVEPSFGSWGVWCSLFTLGAPLG